MKQFCIRNIIDEVWANQNILVVFLVVGLTRPVQADKTQQVGDGDIPNQNSQTWRKGFVAVRHQKQTKVTGEFNGDC